MTRKATKYFIIRRSNSEGSTSSPSETSGSRTEYLKSTTPQYDGPPKLSTVSDYNKEAGAKLTLQKILNKDKVIQTKRGPFEIVESAAWGGILIPVEDPNSLDITTQDLESVRLVDNFPKIPAELWSRWVSLCFHFCFKDKEPSTSTSSSSTSNSSTDSDKIQAEFIFENGIKKKYNPELKIYQVCEDQDPTTLPTPSNLPETKTITKAISSSNKTIVPSEYEAIKFTKINGSINRYGHDKISNSWVFLDIVSFAQETTPPVSAPTGEKKASRGWFGDDMGGEYGASRYSGGYSGGNTSYNNSELEVSCLLLRKISDLSQWRILIPTQNVTRGSVNATFDKCCDLVTGEEITQFPPPGWAHAGSSHSHNTMTAFFSSTDDSNELGVPGLHIVLGSLLKYDKSYKAKASIVLRQNRRILDINQVVDTTPQDNKFHPNVLNYIHTGNSSGNQTSTPSVKEEEPKKAPPEVSPSVTEKVKTAVTSILGSLMGGATGSTPDDTKKDEDDPFDFVGM